MVGVPSLFGYKILDEKGTGEIRRVFRLYWNVRRLDGNDTEKIWVAFRIYLNVEFWMKMILGKSVEHFVSISMSVPGKSGERSVFIWI